MTFSKLSPNTSCRGGKQSSSPRPSSSSMLRPALEFHAVKLHQLLHEQPDQILHDQILHGRGLAQVEARGQKGGVEEQPNLILHGLVRLARLQLLKFLLLILALDAKTLLRRALEFHAVKLHQLLHEQPDQILHGRGLVQVEARSQQGGIEEQPDQVLHGLVILARLQYLKILLLNLVLGDKTLLRRALEFIAVKLLQLLHASLNHGATMDRTSRPFFRRVPGKGMRTPA